MKNLILFFALLPVMASAQPVKKSPSKELIERWDKEHKIMHEELQKLEIERKAKLRASGKVNPIIDTLSLPNYYKGDGILSTETIVRCAPTLPPITVRIYRDDDDPLQTLIDALKKAGVIVERREWNYENGYSEYIIKKQ